MASTDANQYASKPTMQNNKEIERELARATHHRDQLHAIAKGIVEKHGEEPGSDEADELMLVVLDGECYEEAKERMIQIKKYRS